MFKKTSTRSNAGSVQPICGAAIPNQSCPVPSSRNAPSLTLNDIRLRAYRKWEAAGRPEGDGSRFWLQAEQELLQGK